MKLSTRSRTSSDRSRSKAGNARFRLTAQRPLTHDGRKYAKGELVFLDLDTALALVRIGAVHPALVDDAIALRDAMQAAQASQP